MKPGKRKQRPFKTKCSAYEHPRKNAVLFALCLSAIANRPYIQVEASIAHQNREFRAKKVSWDAGTDSSTEDPSLLVARLLAPSPLEEQSEQSTVATMLNVLTMDLDENVQEMYALEGELLKLEQDLDELEGVNLDSVENSTLGADASNPMLPESDLSPSSSNFPSSSWTEVPSGPPSAMFTHSPTESMQPSDFPSDFPSFMPTLSIEPSSLPSLHPTNAPSISMSPSELPSQGPSAKPSLSSQPSSDPSLSPSLGPTVSMEPSLSPSTSMAPSVSTQPSDNPSGVPTFVSSTSSTSLDATLREDAGSNSIVITERPSLSPTKRPSGTPTASLQPSSKPSTSTMPSAIPTGAPSSFPSISLAPTQAPTTSRSPSWSASPSDIPSSVPSDQPSFVPTFSAKPSQDPSWGPSSLPTLAPSSFPSTKPSRSLVPSASPSWSPSRSPSESPSNRPSTIPSDKPSSQPSKHPTISPSAEPSSVPSSSPTLTCHDEPYYRSPINGFTCADHRGTSCLQWRHLGLSLDDMEELIVNCPVSCEIDCGTLTRFDITIEYQISKVPGLLDAATVDDLNTITASYLSDYMRVRQKALLFYIDNVELLSQERLNRGTLTSASGGDSKNNGSNRKLAEDSTKSASVNLWVTVAVRGFAFSLSLKETTEGLLAGIDSLAYSTAIQNSGNIYLEEAYAFSAAEAPNGLTNTSPEDAGEDANGSSAAVVVVFVVAICVGACCASAYVIHKRWRNGFCCHPPKSNIVERDLQSPESQNVASAVGSMFSFDDTATAGTNGLMRFISSFSRSKDSTSPGSSVQHSLSRDGMEDDSPDEELGLLTPRADAGELHKEEESSAEEEEPHPLTGIIPPMIVYDHIDEDEDNELGTQKVNQPKKPRVPSLVPSRRIEASSSFIAALGKRQRPSATHDLADLFSEPNFFIADPFTDPYTNWRRLESRRPSPIGILMDSDDVDDDEISVASTPVRLTESDSDTQVIKRRTRSLDSSSILESLSDIIVTSDHDFEATVSPIAIPALGVTVLDSPSQIQGKSKLVAPLPLLQSDSPTNHTVSPDRDEDPDWEAGHPETPSLRGNSSHSVSSRTRQPGGAPEPRNSFWNRSPIAKGVKEAIWSTKRVGTPTKSSAPGTPTRNDIHPRRALVGAPPTTPTRDMAARRSLGNGPPPSSPARLDVPVARRGSFNLPPPSTPTSRPPELPATRRSSTPTRLEMIGRRVPTPPRGEQGPRRSTSPSLNAVPMLSNSEESQTESRRSLRSRSASFSTAQESMEEEVIFEFRAQRIGKLGLVINSSPQTGPMVEQVKDYSTLFGRIHAGDRIVEVDGVETSHMSIKDVTKRLAGKYGIRTATGEVRIKVARIREREWNDSEERRSVHSNGSGSVDSFYSYHRRNHSDPEPFLDRLSLNSMSGEHRLSSHSYSNLSKSGEEV